MIEIPESLRTTVRVVEDKLDQRPVLKSMFGKCFLNTLETTVALCDDGTVYMITGDIDAMWLRDSSAQVRQYLPYASGDKKLQKFLEGLIKRQFYYINLDAYANAFNKGPNGRGHTDDITDMSPWVWERKYEIDSLCYPVQLIYLYWKETNNTSLFDSNIRKTLKDIIRLWKLEQRHHQMSPYRFSNPKRLPHDTLHNGGMGEPVNFTGMTWSGFRPSDDSCVYGYFLPSNMFAVVVLRYIEEIAGIIYEDHELQNEAHALALEIDSGIRTYGIFNHPRYGLIYACETDGYGNYRLFDDANIPSLLSIPYLGYSDVDDPVYMNTRKFVLSEENPYFYQGKYAKGIGSPHTPKGYIWPMALIMQAITSNSRTEIEEILGFLENTHDQTGFMHEGFNADDPSQYTRPWFSWANSLFSELICKLAMKMDFFN